MPYCVNCGVEVNAGAAVCPLCQTPVWHPEDAPESAAPYFPTKPAMVEPVVKRATAWLVTSMLVSVAVCCGVVNLFFYNERAWSLYIIGAVVMLWIWLVLPMLVRRMPMFFRLTLDVAAVGIYVYLISIDRNGGVWFRGLALPILANACVVVFVLSYLLRDNRRSILSTLSLCIGAAGLFVMGVGLAIDLYVVGHWVPGWSLVVLVICVGLIIPLRIIRRVPSLREEVRRRFSL